MEKKKKEYSLEKDHKAIKKQIKCWEKDVDELLRRLVNGKAEKDEAIAILEFLSHEMCAINI